MYDQMFETYRKTSESWLQMQQDMFKNLPPEQMQALVKEMEDIQKELQAEAQH